MGKKDKDQAKKLIKKIAADEKLACRVRQASLDELAAIAKEEGIDVTRKQLKRAIESQGDELENTAHDLDKKGIKGSENLRVVAEWSG